MRNASLAALLFPWWRDQEWCGALILSQAPLTAAGSDHLPVPSPDPASRAAQRLSFWGESLAPWVAAEPADTGARAGLSTPPTAAAVDDVEGALGAFLRALLSAMREAAPQPEANSGFAGLLDQPGPSSEPAGAPLCSCALCQGMSVGPRWEMLDRFSRRNAPQEPDAAAPSSQRGPVPVLKGPSVAAGPAAPASIPVASGLTIADADVLNLETNPGASKTIYLNFLGADLSRTAWVPSGSRWNGIAPAFSLDSDTSLNFSSAERAAIKEIFARVACDYAPFNINVTTKAPAIDRINRSSSGDSIYGTVCLFSNISSQTGYGNSGGVAYVGVFGDLNSEQFKPALVFPNKLANSAKIIAEAASHELGHNLGLSHDGIRSVEYYSGQGSSPGWAPIMGVGYSMPLTQFSRGDYSGATNIENDFSLIAAEGVSYWLDSVGNDRATATALTLTDANADGVTDKLQRGGTIELTASNGLGVPDRDVYSFLAPSNGSVTINVRNALYFFDPAAGQPTFAPVPSGYGNLRLDARLEDANGTVLADWNTNSSLDVSNLTASNLVGGRNYYLSVFANASSPDGEDTYGSLGDYVFDLVYQGQAPTPGLPTLSLTVSPQSVDENSGSALVFTFTRSGSTSSALSFNVNIAGTATAGSDYTGVSAGATVLQFAAGSATTTLRVTPVNDSSVETDETVVVSLASGSGYVVAGPASATGTIRSDDLPPTGPTPTYSLSGPASVQEGQALTIGITASNAVDGASLNWRFSGSGISADDFAPAALTGTATFTASLASLSLTVAADNAIEPTETALFELLDGSTVLASLPISLLDTNARWGTSANDTITGTANRFERITGVPSSGTTAASLGSGQRDVVTGGAGADEFLLSEQRGGSLRVFYNDNNNSRTGTSDFLQIQDFNPKEDKLRFASGRYFSRNSGSTTQIWYDRNNNGSLSTLDFSSNSDELIAVLSGVNLGSATLTSTSTPSWAVFG